MRRKDPETRARMQRRTLYIIPGLIFNAVCIE